MKEKECAQMVAGEGKWGSFHQSRCMKKPTKYEDNKWWCTTHSPSYKKGRREKDLAKWDAETAKRQEQRKRVGAISEITRDVSTEFMEQNPNILRDIQGE